MYSPRAEYLKRSLGALGDQHLALHLDCPTTAADKESTTSLLVIREEILWDLIATKLCQPSQHVSVPSIGCTPIVTMSMPLNSLSRLKCCQLFLTQQKQVKCTVAKKTTHQNRRIGTLFLFLPYRVIYASAPRKCSANTDLSPSLSERHCWNTKTGSTLWNLGNAVIVGYRVHPDSRAGNVRR